MKLVNIIRNLILERKSERTETGHKVPGKYLTKDKSAMKREIQRVRNLKSDDPSAYGKWEADYADKKRTKKYKTKKSAATKAYEKMFGSKKESFLDIVEEAVIPNEITIYSKHIDFLKKNGVKQSINGTTLYFPPNIIQELRKNERAPDAKFKKEFMDLWPVEELPIASMVASKIKKKLEKDKIATKFPNGKVYYALDGKLSKNGNFRFIVN